MLTDGIPHGARVAPRVEHVLLDEPAAHVLRQPGQRERRQRRPGRHRHRPLAGAGEVEEQAAPIVPAALEQRSLDALRPRRPGLLAAQPPDRVQRQRVGDVEPDVLDVVVVARDDAPRLPARAPAALDEHAVAEPVVRETAVDGLVLRRVVEPRLVGQDDRQQVVAVGVALAREPVEVRAERAQAPRSESRDRLRLTRPRRSPTRTPAAAGRPSRCSQSPRKPRVAYSGARRQPAGASQKTVCGRKPSGRPERSTVRSSARARAGSI